MSLIPVFSQKLFFNNAVSVSLPFLQETHSLSKLKCEFGILVWPLRKWEEYAPWAFKGISTSASLSTLKSHCSEEHNNVAPGESSKVPSPCDQGVMGLSDRDMGLPPEQQSPSFCSARTPSLTAAHWCGCALRLCIPSPTISIRFVHSLLPPDYCSWLVGGAEWVSTVELSAWANVAVLLTLSNV